MEWFVIIALAALVGALFLVVKEVASHDQL